MANAPEPFCRAIQKIIHSGRHKFKPIWGKLDLVSEEYFGELTPPGLEDCFGWLNGEAYHCHSPAGLSTEAVADSYERYNQILGKCLPDDWKTSQTDSARANAGRSTRYQSELSPISLTISERSKRQNWYVDFYFRP